MCVDGCVHYLCISTRKILKALTVLPSVLLSRVQHRSRKTTISGINRVSCKSAVTESKDKNTELEMWSFKESQFGRLRSTREADSVRLVVCESPSHVGP